MKTEELDSKITAGRSYDLGEGEGLFKDHLMRYAFALDFIKPTDVVLDGACGSGYGSHILREKAARVVGVDRSEHAISWGKAHYPEVEFMQVDFNEPIPLKDKQFDVVISFETIEHVMNQSTMLSELKRVLKPSGILIISTPDRIISEKPGFIKNTNHVKELTKKEFIARLVEFFSIERVYGQTFYHHPMIRALKRRLGFLKKILPRRATVAVMTKLHAMTPVALEGPSTHQTLIAVCKNAPKE